MPSKSILISMSTQYGLCINNYTNKYMCFVPLWLESDSNVVHGWWHISNDQTSRLSMNFFFYDVHAQTKSHVHEFVGMNVTDFHLSIYFVLPLPLVRCCWKTVYWRFWNGCFCLLALHVMSMWVLFDYHMICLLIGLVPFCRGAK